MILTESLRTFPTTYAEGEYRTGITGTSDCNEYIPLYALGAHKLITFDNSDVKVLEYNFPTSAIHVSRVLRGYSNLSLALKSSNTIYNYYFKVGGITNNIKVTKGLIYDDNSNILLCLGINSKYVLDTPINTVRGNPDKDKFVLFISTELDQDRYKNLKRKLNELYIEEFKSLGIDIVLSSKIPTWLFKNNSKPLKFSTITKMNKHLKEELPAKILDMA